LRAWNDTARDMDAPPTLVDLFRRQVAANPDALAVRAVDDAGHAVELTYAELEARSNQLAHYLLSLGLPPESPVGVMLPKSADVLVAILGVMKAGLVYLPLDPAYPEDRLWFMIEDAGVQIVISDQLSVINQKSEDRTSDSGPRTPDSMTFDVLRFTDYALRITSDEVLSQPTTNPNITLHPENLAYIIYTSGSTGRPKGVMAHHRGVVNFALGFQDKYQLAPGDRVLQFASLNFDASIADIFITMTAGATLVFGPPDITSSAEALLDFLQRERITSAVLPPSLLAVLPDAVLSDLRIVVSAGEACTWEVVKRWAHGRKFFNGYGPTETSVGVSLRQVRAEEANDQPVPIGKPIPNLTFHVLDAHQQPVPVGVPGELYIGGVGVTRGYLGRPALTAERFLPDPFLPLENHEDTKTRRHEEEKSKEIRENPLHPRHPRRIETLSNGQRLYRTGDLVKRLPNGDLVFLGRVDHQVKVRGYRIELGEIERQLDAHPGVQKSAVVLQQTGASKRLIAYFVSESDPPPDAQTLRDFLARFLPDYMIPAHFVPLDALPLTPSGKIDRIDLARRPVALAQAPAGSVLPRDEREAILARIWSELLGLETVGVDDNFFELGGDSILAIQMISRAADEGILITAKQLFQHPTIAGLAAVAET
ncbi:MAG TPA: amino acid adenylation domain-containing protein, partial [Anaerolineae bacterium]|nr:amino acid adenylation domain-containing protein [Anaerolineae bacterium]